MLHEFGPRLASIRRARKLSQGQLAARSGIAQAHISHFECGVRKPRPENLVKLADALGTTTDFLLGRTLDSEPPAPQQKEG